MAYLSIREVAERLHYSYARVWSHPGLSYRSVVAD